MGLCEIFCENIENMWRWIEEHPDDAKLQRDVILKYLLESHLMVQLYLGNTDCQEVISRRIDAEIALKWFNIISLEKTIDEYHNSCSSLV